MAAVTHLKNKREAERREKINQIFMRCGDSEEIEISRFIDYLSSVNVNLDEHDVHRLNKITSEEGTILKDDFMHFFKRCDTLKDYVDSSRRAENLDKAVLAFKAIDKDGSGSITVAELGQLSSAMSKKKCEALMKKLDADGDGKITLEEFRALFQEVSHK